MVFKVINHDKVPKFNSPVFLENKTAFGVIDEILGPVKEVVRLLSSPKDAILRWKSIFADANFVSPVLHCQAQEWLYCCLF